MSQNNPCHWNEPHSTETSDGPFAHFRFQDLLAVDVNGEALEHCHQEIVLIGLIGISCQNWVGIDLLPNVNACSNCHENGNNGKNCSAIYKIIGDYLKAFIEFGTLHDEFFKGVSFVWKWSSFCFFCKWSITSSCSYSSKFRIQMCITDENVSIGTNVRDTHSILEAKSLKPNTSNQNQTSNSLWKKK